MEKWDTLYERNIQLWGNIENVELIIGNGNYTWNKSNHQM
jgi:hypothetical protein